MAAARTVQLSPVRQDIREILQKKKKIVKNSNCLSHCICFGEEKSFDFNISF